MSWWFTLIDYMWFFSWCLMSESCIESIFLFLFFLFFFFFSFFKSDEISFCGLGWPRNFYVTQALQLTLAQSDLKFATIPCSPPSLHFIHLGAGIPIVRCYACLPGGFFCFFPPERHHFHSRTEWWELEQETKSWCQENACSPKQTRTVCTLEKFSNQP